MKLKTLSLFVLAARSAEAGGNGSDALTVHTTSGAYTGMIDPKYPNTRQWRSIPFAEAPVGWRRWLPPEKYTPPPSARPTYSTKYPASCPQFVSSAVNFWSLPLSQGNLIYNGAQNDTSGLVGEATSEDCLYLAVWSPTGTPPAGGWPVAFFMTGGGFVMGGVELPWQDPIAWAERSKSHVIVSINYRLNIFGFPKARGLNVTGGHSQNLGILDQRAALEWTRDNIAAFGGDPARIMQWGRSAGSISVDYHSYAFHEDPIAQSYYAESGLVWSLGAELPPPTFTDFSIVAQNVGCGSPCGPAGCPADDNGEAELDCMRKVSMIQISNFIGQYADRGEQPPLDFHPHPDERIVFSNYTLRSEAGLIARRPMVVSFTANEFSTLYPWPANPAEGVNQTEIDEINIEFANCAGLYATMYRNRIGVPVFRFQYAAQFPNLNVYDWLGAYHNSETPLLFGTYHQLDHIANSTEFQKEVSDSMQDHLLAFVKDPFHGPQTLGWEPMDTSAPDGGFLLRFGGKSGKVALRVPGIDVDGVCTGVRNPDPFP